MKTLILTRHAKSDWSHPDQHDFDRELNARGLKDAVAMGLRLSKRGIHIDSIISSTAKRAATTALLIAKEMNYKEQNIHWLEKLYHAAPHIIQDVIAATDNQHDHIMVVCHNNGITDFANSLIGFITNDMATCAMIAFQIDTDHWSDFVQAKKTMLFFDFPKN